MDNNFDMNFTGFPLEFMAENLLQPFQMNMQLPQSQPLEPPPEDEQLDFHLNPEEQGDEELGSGDEAEAEFQGSFLDEQSDTDSDEGEGEHSDQDDDYQEQPFKASSRNPTKARDPPKSQSKKSASSASVFVDETPINFKVASRTVHRSQKTKEPRGATTAAKTKKQRKEQEDIEKWDRLLTDLMKQGGKAAVDHYAANLKNDDPTKRHLAAAVLRATPMVDLSGEFEREDNTEIVQQCLKRSTEENSKYVHYVRHKTTGALLVICEVLKIKHGGRLVGKLKRVLEQRAFANHKLLNNDYPILNSMRPSWMNTKPLMETYASYITVFHRTNKTLKAHRERFFNSLRVCVEFDLNSPEIIKWREFAERCMSIASRPLSPSLSFAFSGSSASSESSPPSSVSEPNSPQFETSAASSSRKRSNPSKELVSKGANHSKKQRTTTPPSFVMRVPDYAQSSSIDNQSHNNMAGPSGYKIPRSKRNPKVK